MIRAVLFISTLLLCGYSAVVAQVRTIYSPLQTPPLTEGLAAQSSLNELIQRLPPGQRKNSIAIELNTLAMSARRSGNLQFGEEAQRAKSAVIEARSASLSLQEKEVLTAIAGTIRATEKAYYSREIRRNYPPEAYKLIFDRTRSSAALVDKATSAPFCSGSLLTSTVLLTAGHCIRNRLAGELEIWLDYVQNVDGSMISPLRLDVEAVLYAPSAPDLDFALLKVKTVPKDASRVNPLCLSTDRVRIREILYVIGHPQQRPLTVHDFAEVLFPHEVTRPELDQILIDQRADNVPQETLDSIVQSYNQTPTSMFVNNSKVWAGRPTIGVLADTFQGNSGAAVFSRNSHRIVGVFVQGQPDYQEAWEPSWLRHEAVLPATKVIEDLRKNTNLLDSEKICAL